MSILNVNQIQPLGGGSTITVSANDVNFSGNISIGSSFVGTASTASLATSAQGLTGTPDITVGNIQSGVVTATTFIGDGSGLTGVTASGSGINIKDGGSTVGVAATIDFSTNLNVSPAAAGIVTVTVGDTDFAIADKIVHTGDTNTSIRFPAADTVTVETAGSEALRIDANGRIAQGGKTPTSHGSPNLLIWGSDPTVHLTSTGSTANTSYTGIKFAVAGGSTGDYSKAGIFVQRQDSYNDLDMIFAFRSSNDAAGVAISDEKLRINSDGRMLLGTTTVPTGLVLGNSLTAASSTGAEVVAFRSDTSVAVGDKCGAFVIGNSDTDGVEDHFVGMWGKVASTNGSMDLHFAAGRASYEGDTPDVTIKSGGNIGINTDNPTQGKLVAQTASGMSIAAVKDNTGASISLGGVTQPRILFESDPSASTFKLYTATGSSYGSAGWSERLRIDSSGRIGINTNTFNDAAEALRVQAPSGQDNTHLTIKAGSTTGYSVLNFGDNDFNEGRIKYDHNGNIMELFADDTGFMKYEDDATLGGGRWSLTSTGTYLTANTVDYYINAGSTRTYGLYVHKNNTGGTYGIYCYTLGGNSTQYSIGGQADTSSSYSSGGGLFYSINSNTYGIVGYWSTSAYYSLYGNGVSLCTGGHTTSDARLKDVQSGIGTGILDKVCSLEAKKYTWKENTQQRRSVGVGTQIGLLAQDVLEHFPEVVMEHENPEIAGHNPETLNEQIGTTYSIDYGKMTAVLIEAIKDLKEENNALAARVAALEGS